MLNLLKRRLVSKPRKESNGPVQNEPSTALIVSPNHQSIEYTSSFAVSAALSVETEISDLEPSLMAVSSLSEKFKQLHAVLSESNKKQYTLFNDFERNVVLIIISAIREALIILWLVRMEVRKQVI